jgi:hypothetical protein
LDQDKGVREGWGRARIQKFGRARLPKGDNRFTELQIFSCYIEVLALRAADLSDIAVRTRI